MGNGYIGIMEKKMEPTRAYRDYIGIMENRMNGNYYSGFRVEGFWGCSGKENQNYYNGLYRVEDASFL